MTSKLLALSSLAFTSLLGACVDAGDTAPDTTDTNEVASPILTKHDKCSVGHDPNASITANQIGVTDTYTRSGDTIDYDCDCKAWQVEDNRDGNDTNANADHPLCRPGTFVDIKFDVWAPITAYEVETPSWALTNGKTECLNSTLADFVYKSINGQWVEQPAMEEARHPSWDDATGKCYGVSLGGGGTAGDLYRIHARATRGLAADNHGYETVKISAYNENE